MSGLASWWQDVLDDLEPDTATVTITMSREMVERTRRFLALTETGPDYRAAKRAYEDAPVPIRSEDFVRRIVDAALADYLTEDPTP